MESLEPPRVRVLCDRALFVDSYLKEKSFGR